MIKAIIFDCFGVLTTDKWKEFVASLPKSQVEAASSLNRAYDAGHLTHDEFLQSIKALTGKQPAAVEDLLDNETTKNSQLLDYIEQLKPHYKIGMLSNVATGWVTDSFLTASEQKLFDAMVFSYDVGASKPDHRMYEAIIERLGVAPEECLFIDDSEGHCVAARDSGMQTIWYQNFGQMKTELEKSLAQK